MIRCQRMHEDFFLCLAYLRQREGLDCTAWDTCVVNNSRQLYVHLIHAWHLQAILINQGWECRHASGKAVIARLAKMPMTQLCPIGFIFIWVDKTLVSL